MGTPLKRAASGARAVSRGIGGLYGGGEKKELMDLKMHQAGLSQIRGTNSRDSY